MAAGHKVTVFDNLSSGLRQNMFAENGFIYGNILIQSDLDAAFAQGFDAFAHLAAFKAAGESMVLPEKYSVIFITHKLKEVLEISDNITVLKNGRVVGNVLPSEVDEKTLANMMVGRDVLLLWQKSVLRVSM